MQIATVVDQLRGRPKLLHKYLHALFVKDPHVGAAFHEAQVELYAEFEPSKLLPFLRQSNHYPLKMVRGLERGKRGRNGASGAGTGQAGLQRGKRGRNGAIGHGCGAGMGHACGGRV